MTGCEISGMCSFFDGSSGAMPESTTALRSRYCKGDKLSCARYMVKKKLFEGYSLPGDHALDMVGKYLTELHPEDMQRAKQIIGLMVKQP